MVRRLVSRRHTANRFDSARMGLTPSRPQVPGLDMARQCSPAAARTSREHLFGTVRVANMRRLRSRRFQRVIQSLRNIMHEPEPQIWQSESYQRWISSDCRGQCEVGKHYEDQKWQKGPKRGFADGACKAPRSDATTTTENLGTMGSLNHGANRPIIEIRHSASCCTGGATAILLL